MWPFRNPGSLQPIALPSAIKGIILVNMDKTRSQARSCSSSREEERESCRRTLVSKLKMTQKLHVTLPFTPHGPELSRTATLSCKRGWNAVSNGKPRTWLQILSKERNVLLDNYHSLPQPPSCFTLLQQHLAYSSSSREPLPFTKSGLT